MLGSIAALSALGLGPGRARAAVRTKVFRLATSNAVESQTGAGAAAFASQVAALSGGRLRIEVYPASEAGGELPITQDTAKGALELCLVSAAGYANLVPRLGVFDIPFLFRDVAHARTVLDGSIGQKALSEMKAANIVGLSWGENGLRHLTTATVPVRQPKDLAGLKIRVPQSEVMLSGFRAMGADAQPLPFPDLYGALSAGTFQAQENPLSNIATSRFDRVQKYLSLTGHVYSANMLLIGRIAYESLSDDERALLHTAARAVTQASREVGDRAEAETVAELRQRGMTVVTDVDRQAFAAAMSPAQAGYEAQFGKAMLTAIRTAVR
ncbi:TRAP transporter substrate-binding protein [Methylobacterium planeticum]|uniref:TRAP transporter substrate-binding protein n=1 Tax=Methylobacterium planeticum TaxID=2615211 RepID=UPI001781D01A|nr:TRAP transporter substrate-binding protein [Methylobacterium planeticum]